MDVITSLQNERVKRVVKLQRKASARRDAGRTVIEGAREVSRAIANGWCPEELWVSKKWESGAHFFREMGGLRPANLAEFHCSEHVFDKITYRDNPDGVLAVGPLVGKTLAELVLPENPLILVAEGVEKPGNLGALLRTADGSGVDAVIVCDAATDLNNPKVIRSSIGTLFYLPVAVASFDETVSFLKANGVATLAAVPDAERVYTQVELSGPVAWVVGAEDRGLSSNWKNQADIAVRIPMLGKNDSLNVSVAAAILLYEALRQRN